ncbi:uncharacterized protein LAJ45_06009 [Morchella importuna]|nr:uncharacterized protein LAJ45_06009 [Morchella importuna]KAH8149857.1 hypothetical protein LAJ45_06009 [Morchella importuna]
MDQLQNVIDGFIDFEGQRLAEQLTTVLLGLAGIVAFLVGFVMKDLSYTVWIGLGGTALTVLAVVPPWPMYNRNGLKWLPVEGGQGKKTQ